MSIKQRAGVFFSLLILLVLPLTVWSVRNLNFETRKRAEEPKLPVRVISAASFSQYQRPIIIVDLLVDRPSKNVEIVSLKKGTGIVPDYKNSKASDYVEVCFDKKSGGKTTFLIPLPAGKSADQVIKNSALTGREETLDQILFSIPLPFEEESIISIKNQSALSTISAVTETTTSISLSTSDKAKAIVTNRGIAQEMRFIEISPEKIVHGQSIDFQIEEIFDGDPSSTDPSRALDIVFVSSGFLETTFNSFRNFSDLQSDLLIGLSVYSGKSPFPENKRIIKIRRVVSSANYGNSPETIDFNLIKTDLTVLGIPYDQIIVVTTAQGQFNYGLFGLGCILLYNEDPSPILAHELGHSIGGLSDEYISGNQSRELVRHDRNCKEDPLEPWINNSEGGSYLWCGFARNLYKPEENSLMGRLDYDFNAPSKYVLEEALSVYSEAISFVVWSDRIYFYRDLDSPSQSNFPYAPSIQNYSNHQISFSALLNPAVDWLRAEGTTGTVDPSPSSANSLRLITDFGKINSRGKYQTTLLVTATDAYGHQITKEVPILLVAGGGNDNPSLNISNPTNGEIFNEGSIIPILISSQVTQPGWKRIEYFYSIPDQEDINYPLILSSRTIAPFSASWDTSAKDPTLGSRKFSPGTYLLWAEGYPYFGQGGYPFFSQQPVKTDVVEIEFPAPDGSVCTGIYYWFVCSNQKYSRRCFRNTSDCTEQGFTYCCPPLYEPTPSPTTCPNQNLGNLDCDQQALINEGDLSILLAEWGSITVTDLDILLSNWKTQ